MRTCMMLLPWRGLFCVLPAQHTSVPGDGGVCTRRKLFVVFQWSLTHTRSSRRSSRLCSWPPARAHACLLARAGSRAAHHRHQLFRLVRATTGIVISARDEAVDWSHRAPRGCRPCTCSAAGRCRTRKERACETFRACRRRSWTARRRSIAMPRGGCAQSSARSRSRTIEPLLARHGTTALSVVIDVWSQARPTHRTALPIGKKSHCGARVTLAPSSAVHVRADQSVARLQLRRSEWRRPTRTPRAAA